MIDAISSGPNIPLRTQSAKIEIPERNAKLDLDSIPESKVRIQPPEAGSAGQGKGLKIDIKA